MAKGNRIASQRPKRTEIRQILIACEGSKTEPQYLDRLKEHLREVERRKHHSFKVISCSKTDPNGVVEAVIEARDRSSKDIDEAWALVDVDQHQTLDAAARLAKTKKVRLTVSHPCFEIWLLWHYQDHRRHDDAARLRDLLKSKGHSDKDIPKAFPIAEYPAAVRRAEPEAPRVGDTGPNPSTAMPHLIRSILDI